MNGQALHYSPWRLIQLAILCAIGAAGFLWMAADPAIAARNGAASLLFGLLGAPGCVVVGGVLAFGVVAALGTMVNLAAVRIEADGLLVRTLFTSRTIAWSDVFDLGIRRQVVQGRPLAQLRIGRRGSLAIDVNLKLLREDDVAVDAFVMMVLAQQRVALAYRPAQQGATPTGPVPVASFGRRIVNR